MVLEAKPLLKKEVTGFLETSGKPAVSAWSMKYTDR